jgi:hypothetical protein
MIKQNEANILFDPQVYQDLEELSDTDKVSLISDIEVPSK